MMLIRKSKTQSVYLTTYFTSYFLTFTAARLFLLVPGLLFEVVVVVGIPTLAVCHYAGDQVCRNEQRSPTLVLPNVDSFMMPAPDQYLLIPGDDDMPKSDGMCAALQRNAMLEEPRNGRTIQFYDSLYDPDAISGQHGGGYEEEPK